MKEEVRIQKFMSDCGVMSRRKAEEEILNGKIKVNGKKAEIGQKVTEDDLVEYMGKIVEKSGEKYYVMLNKPRGYVSTMSDDKDRKCVSDLVRDFPARIYPIGRLDYNSEGLLIFTNDGEVANKMMHPKNEIEKTYHVKVKGKIEKWQLDKLNRSMDIDGYTIKPAKVTVFSETKENQVLQFIITEGRNRQIRKMCENVGVFVMRLKRIKEGALELGELPTGKWRRLTKKEENLLKEM